MKCLQHLCIFMLVSFVVSQRSYDFSKLKVRTVTSPHAQDYEWFGSRVDISGDYMVVGAPGSDSSKLVGYAYVYHRDARTDKWSKVAQLAGSSSNDGFGSVVRIQGGNIIVGAYKDSSRGTAAGCVYHFAGGTSGFTRLQQITANDGSAGDYFGASVAMYNREELLVGAWGQSVDGNAAAGAAYFYRYRDDAWRFEAKFTGENPTLYQWYGISVALFASKGVVGAWGDASGGSLAGAIYAYNHISGVWVYMQCIKGNAGDQLGYSLSMNSDVLIAGAPSAYRSPLSDNSDSSSRTGAAFMYRLTDYNHWQYEEVITCKYCAAGDAYGSAVAAEHDSVVVGKIGGADVFQYDSRYASGYRWTKVTALQTGNDELDYSVFFGSSIGMDGAFIALGVKDADSEDGAVTQGGSVVVFAGQYNSTNSATYSAVNMAIYVAMYMLVVVGIFVLLAAPAALIAKHLYEDTKAKASILEMKPFIKGKASSDHMPQKVSL